MRASLHPSAEYAETIDPLRELLGGWLAEEEPAIGFCTIPGRSGDLVFRAVSTVT